MANFGSTENLDDRSAYAQSFGPLQHKTIYSDPLGLKSATNVDLKSDDHILRKAWEIGMKATNTQSGGAGTAGYAMIPVFVDPRVIDQTRKYTPLCEIIPRVTNQGMYADYNVITAKGGASYLPEDSALSETTTTYDRNSTQIKFVYAVGRVTGPSIAAQPSYILAGFQPAGSASMASAFGDQSASNSLQQEVLVKTREIKEAEENEILNGSTSVNANGFSGIVTLMGATNTVDKNTSALSLADIDLAIQYAFDDGGRPNFAVCSSGVYKDLLGLLNAKIGYLQPVQKVMWGFSAIVLNTMVGEIPVIPSMYLVNTTGLKAIYFLDMSVVEMRVLQDLTYEELAKTNDSRKFMLKMYECLIIKNTNFCSSITEIS